MNDELLARLDAIYSSISDFGQRLANIEGQLRNGIVKRNECQAMHRATMDDIEQLEATQRRWGQRLWGVMVAVVLLVLGFFLRSK